MSCTISIDSYLGGTGGAYDDQVFAQLILVAVDHQPSLNLRLRGRETDREREMETETDICAMSIVGDVVKRRYVGNYNFI